VSKYQSKEESNDPQENTHKLLLDGIAFLLGGLRMNLLLARQLLRGVLKVLNESKKIEEETIGLDEHKPGTNRRCVIKGL
jgi:hypothetical protein